MLPPTASIANVSGQLYPNKSSTSIARFSFIIPYDQTQDCDIYGPICQTGLITVGVDLTTATTTTVLPCSSYLSTQSTYLEYGDLSEPHAYPEGWTDGFYIDFPDLTKWANNFGRSPECRSYASAMSRGQYIFPNCGSSNMVIQTDRGWDFSYPLQIPPGFMRIFPGMYSGTCCGNCSLDDIHYQK